MIRRCTRRAGPPGWAACGSGLATGLVVILILAISPARPSAAPFESFADDVGAAGRVLIWAGPDGLDGRLAALDPRRIARLGQVSLLEIDAGVMGSLDPERIADPRAWTMPTCLCTGPPTALDRLPPGIEHLSRGSDRWWLVRGTTSALESLALRGMSLVRLHPPGAASWPAARPQSPPGRHAAPDPRVAQLVLQMSEDEVTATVQRLQDFATRYSYGDSCLAAADYLHGRFAAMGLEVELDWFDLDGTPAANVVATQWGTERPDEIHVVCGHYDSFSDEPWTDAPGADDNGSGAAAVVEAARVLAAQPFEGTVRYICFGGEEQGLVGSRHYVRDIVVAQGLDVRAVVNLDMIGYVHPDYPEWDVNIFADEPLSRWLGEHLARCVRDYSTCVDYLLLDSGPVYGSDHFWFAQYGYPAVFGIEAQLWGAPDWNEYYHTIWDRIETMDLFYLTDFARGAVAAIAELAVPATGGAVADERAIPAVAPAVVASPNPFAERAVFEIDRRVAGVDDGRVEIRIVDAHGRLMTRLLGRDRLVWNGRDAGDRRLPSGVYFYQVTAPAGIEPGRLLLLR